MWIIADNLSIFSPVNSDTGLADRGSSLTSSFPSQKRFVYLVIIVYDGALDRKAVTSSS